MCKVLEKREQFVKAGRFFWRSMTLQREIYKLFLTIGRDDIVLMYRVPLFAFKSVRCIDRTE